MEKFTLNIHGSLRTFDSPLVMGILNVTPDSFYDGSRTLNAGCSSCEEEKAAIREKARRMIDEGADIIDVGGCSTRPGSDPVPPEEEMRRVRLGVEAVRSLSSDMIISVDTFRAEVARRSVEEWGADIINDISGGLLDPEMIPTVARIKAPYVMMHMRGTPDTMQSVTDYPQGVAAAVVTELQRQIAAATLAGVADIIIDPGFGFAKTARQNYELLSALPDVQYLLGNRPMLIGVSRKSMIYKPLGLSPADCLPGTNAINTLALERGAAILRVHDVAACRQVVQVWQMFSDNLTPTHD